MNEEGNNLILFFGRFHPLLVHLPIGMLLLVGGLELVGRFTRFRSAAQNRQLILGFAALGACGAALCGLMLAHSGDYEDPVVRWHKWGGVALAASTILTLLLSGAPRPARYRVFLVLTLALLAITSHLGGSITHGQGFLTRYAPAPFRSLFASNPTQPTPIQTPSTDVDAEMFTEFIQPILRDRCASCHGQAKQKGGLRLDSLEAAMKGGENGPVILPGKPEESVMVQRLRLPPEADDHMPPPGKPQPTASEVRLIQLWIRAGTARAVASR